MTRHAPVVACALLALAAGAPAQQAEWNDPSPHTTTFVTVDDGVRLEVLDWGGSGPSIVLLAGLGDTGHAFDDFAPTLTPRYRVIAITRRAHGRSSAPATGYDFARLAEDVLRVLDTMQLNRPVIAGHSFAGEEMHVLGARYAEKIAGLIYIDAAFDRGDTFGDTAYDSVARTLPPTPRATPADLASFDALRAFLIRTQAAAGPPAYLRARYVATADGTIAGMWAPAAPIRQAMAAAMQTAYEAYNPEPIRVPALAIYAMPKSADDLMRRWYDAGDPHVREAVGTLYRIARERTSRHEAWFRKLSSNGRIIEIAGAHHLFFTNPDEVRRHIDTFMSSLERKR
jgi:pimeloyl-ACP methyl ester carboxylesterase